MFDMNPETHRFHLAELDRQLQPRLRQVASGQGRTRLADRVRSAPAALAVVAFVLGGFAGGTLF